MKNLTTSLIAVATFNWNSNTAHITKGKSYPVFKILESKHGQRITIVDDNGNLLTWGASEFKFITN